MAHELMQPYRRIVHDLQDEMRSGRLPPHARLPSNRELRERYAVAAGTVQRALNELRAAGLIYSHQGRGSFVTADAPQAAPSSAGVDVAELQRQITDLTGRLERIERALETGGVGNTGEHEPLQRKG